jgi:hypothetical protein
MGGLFTDKFGAGRSASVAAPPPGAQGSFFEDEAESPPPAGKSKQPTGLKFDAELDLCELDDRDRPGPAWAGRGRELSRAHLSFRSRRMCYQGRQVLVAVHLIDDRPVPLFGRVLACEYDGDGMHRTDLELLPLPDRPTIAAWMAARWRPRPA